MEGLPDIGVTLGLTEGATVVGVMGIIKLLKLNTSIKAQSPLLRVGMVFGVVAVVTVALSVAQGSFDIQTIAATTILVGVTTVGAHAAQKSLRKNDPRRP